MQQSCDNTLFQHATLAMCHAGLHCCASWVQDGTQLQVGQVSSRGDISMDLLWVLLTDKSHPASKHVLQGVEDSLLGQGSIANSFAWHVAITPSSGPRVTIPWYLNPCCNLGTSVAA
jgi:hypothetical protein